MKPITIGILNAYDHRNRGDRAIIEAQIAWIRHKLPTAEFKVFSAAWRENADVFGADGSYPPVIRKYAEWGRLKNGILPLAATGLAALGIPTPAASQAFTSCAAYFLCGGGYLYSSGVPLLSRQLWMHAGNSMLAIRSGKPVMQFPQSWGPITKLADRWICKKLAAGLDCINSRGSVSTHLLRGWNFGEKVIETPDIVLAMAHLRPDLVQRRTAGNGWLGVAPIDFGFAMKRSDATLETYLTRVMGIVERYVADGGAGVTFFPQVGVTGSDEDLPMAEELAARCANKGIPHRLLRDVEWPDYWDEMARVDVFLGSRMHACIFAMVLGIPTVGLAYQPKFVSLFEQLGMPTRCFPIDRFEPADVSIRIAEARQAGSPHRAEVAATVDAIAAEILGKLDECWIKSGFQRLETQ
jgi:colanic acid/amylovoran biosynthesis protein